MTLTGSGFVYKMVKTYSNGAKHTLYAKDGKVEAEKARIDAEDKAASDGITGTWTITLGR